jgi:hypothetical protein
MKGLPTLPRGWWGFELPGYRAAGADFVTYSASLETPVPPIERELDDSLMWLREQPVVPESLAGNPASPKPTRPATAAELDLLTGDAGVRVPAAFATFVDDSDLRTRVRSCTACYLDLADRAVTAPGGQLVHFLSDQQWVLHWLLYAGDDGSEAVVATDRPYGFEGEAPAELTVETDSGGELRPVVCAESFNEFLYRFWIENEIWFAVSGHEEGRALTDEQRRYAEHYRDGG